MGSVAGAEGRMRDVISAVCASLVQTLKKLETWALDFGTVIQGQTTRQNPWSRKKTITRPSASTIRVMLTLTRQNPWSRKRSPCLRLIKYAHLDGGEEVILLVLFTVSTFGVS
jgi:hypothetical protein